MIKILKSFIDRIFFQIFQRKRDLKIGLYGPPNGGKSTLANKICKDWLGEEMSSVSKIPHETREIRIKEKVTVKSGNKELTFNLVDTPGIATKIDYEDFMKKGLKVKDAKKRGKEATKGVIDAIKWLDEMDVVIVVLDSTENPYSQVNVTIVGNLAARKIPVVIVANKTDLRKSSVKKVEAAFPQYDVVGISALNGNNIEEFYESLFNRVRWKQKCWRYNLYHTMTLIL